MNKKTEINPEDTLIVGANVFTMAMSLSLTALQKWIYLAHFGLYEEGGVSTRKDDATPSDQWNWKKLDAEIAREKEAAERQWAKAKNGHAKG